MDHTPGEYDMITADGIQRALDPVCCALHVEVFGEVTSTNTLMKERVSSGTAQPGTVIIADHQTLGRGRSGKHFHSPSGTGLYMSILLDAVSLDTSLISSVTTMSAVAAAEAAETVSGREARIKWVNDIYMDGKKVCGILAEAACSPGSPAPDRVVLGAGFNVCPPDGGFPEELKDIAGSILPGPKDGVRNLLAADFLQRFYSIFTGRRSGYETEYRRRSLLTGREILVLSEDGSRRAFVLGLDEGLRLIVRYEDGEEARLNAGEVSLKLS